MLEAGRVRQDLDDEGRESAATSTWLPAQAKHFLIQGFGSARHAKLELPSAKSHQ